MSSEGHSHQISDLEIICKTLENILKKSFGPKSQYTLLSSSTGHVTLSSDGITILTSLHLSHPIARAIVKSLETSVAIHGDGSKTVILYLSSLVQSMGREVDKFCCNPLATSSDTFLRGFFSRSLHSFLSVHLPRIFDNMTKSVSKEATDRSVSSDFGNILLKLLKPVVDGAVPNVDCSAHVAKVLTNYLIDGCSTVGDLVTRHTWYENSLYLIPEQPFASSSTTDGIFLTSRLFSRPNSLPLKDTNFICLQCVVEESIDKDSSVVQLSSSAMVIGHGHIVFNQFLKYLKSIDVSLLVSVSKIPEFCLQQCLEANVAVIDCIEENDLLWICSTSKKSPVTSLKDKIDAVNMITASICDKVTFGHKSYAKLILDNSFIHPKVLFLCAPSQGICEQLKIKTKKAMKVISQLIDSTMLEKSELLNSSFVRILESNIIAGQGYFEMLLCDQIQSYCAHYSDPGVRMCCSLIQRMLMEVPKLLSENSCNSGSRESSGKFGTHLDLLWKINSTCSGPLYQDNFCDSFILLNCTVAEVLSIKIALVYSAVSLAVKLLRLDDIIAVGGRLSADGFQDYDKP